MKKIKKPLYIRYEFTDPKGTPEGGDVFTFDSASDIQAFAQEILDVANSDQVCVNITVGPEKPFFGFLKAVGMSQKDIESEIVLDHEPPKKAAKKTKKK